MRGGKCSDALVSNLDLVPTVLDMAGLAPPDYMEPPAQRVLYFQHYKYIATEGAAPELYDLEEDPFELDNQSEAPEMRAVLLEMQRRLLGNMDKHGDRGEGAMDIRGQLHV